MLSFKEFREEDGEEKALRVVQKGMNLRDGDFWSDFLGLCGNADGMSSLLGVPREKITGLSEKINALKARAESADAKKKKDKLISTGKVVKEPE